MTTEQRTGPVHADGQPAQVTIVIPTRNNAATITDAVTSSINQSVPVTVIVVDNNSSDTTAQLAEAAGAHVYTHGNERCAQRNHGLAHTDTDYIIFLDSDMRAPHTLAEQTIAAFTAAPAARGAIITEHSFGTSYWARCKTLEKRLYVGDAGVEAARAFRVNELKAVGGWNEKLTSGEDWELTERVRARHGANAITRVPGPLLHNEGHLTLAGTWHKKQYYGTHLAHYLSTTTNPTQHLRRTSLLQPRILASDPAHAPGLFLLKTVEAAGLSVGLLRRKKAQRASRRRGTVTDANATSPGTNTKPTITVAHIIAEYSPHEAMGRTIKETITGTPTLTTSDGTTVPVTHRIITSHIAVPDPDVTVIETGGTVATGLLRRRRRVRAAIADADLIHIHGGTFAPAVAAALDVSTPTVATIYATPTLPERRGWATVTATAARTSNTANVRVIASHLIGARALRTGLARARISHILTADPRVAAQCAHLATVTTYTPGSNHTGTRSPASEHAEGNQLARYNSNQPVLAFIGRGEYVRGLTVFLDTFTAIKKRWPHAKARIALLPAVDSANINTDIARHVHACDITVTNGPVDVYNVAANATIGIWSFWADYVTSPPALAPLEAMAQGLPIVCADVACLRPLYPTPTVSSHVLPANPGILTPVADTHAVIDAVTTLLEDPGQWRTAATNAQHIAAANTWTTVAEKTAHTYRAALPAQQGQGA